MPFETGEGRMKLLLTVARRSEVDTALAAGADLVDVKDPARGSLGRPSLALLAEVARRCDGRCPVSLALGDGPHRPEEVRRAAELALGFGPAYVKVGLAVGSDAGPAGEGRASSDGGDDRARRSLEAVAGAVASAGSDARLVAVTFVDAPSGRAPSPEELVPVARRHGADGVMLDTLSKGGASTLEVLGAGRLRRWAASARRQGLETAVAGGLDESSIPGLAGLGVDVVGVRGGACTGDRSGRLDARRCEAVRRAVDVASSPAPAAG